MLKITPFLWFDNNLEEALEFYTSIFKNSKVLEIQRFDAAGPDGKSMVTTASFRLAGQKFIGLNGGPLFKFTEAISFVVNCQTQREVDYYWRRLTATGGRPSRCGWLKDRFGVSWQIVPEVLMELLGDKDPAKSARVMKAMLKMSKINIRALQRAHAGK